MASTSADSPRSTSPATALRARVHAGRRSERPAAQAALNRHLTGILAGASAVAAYAALPGEPNLDDALEGFLGRGGTVFLPVTIPGAPLAWGAAPGTVALPATGPWGIREPQRQLSAHALAASLVASAETARPIVIVPGLGFSADGTRLGNGGGFYDRTFGPRGALADVRGQLHCIGVCFAEEFGITGAAQPWDLRVDAVLTEAGLTPTGG